MKRLSLVLVLLAAAGPASAQLGSPTDSPACCQLTTSLIKDVVRGKDAPGDERFFRHHAAQHPLPGRHLGLHARAAAGAEQRARHLLQHHHQRVREPAPGRVRDQPRLEPELPSTRCRTRARGWARTRASPTCSRTTSSTATCTGRTAATRRRSGTPRSRPASRRCPNWNTPTPRSTTRCLTCLSTKGYYKVPGTVGRNTAPLDEPELHLLGPLPQLQPAQVRHRQGGAQVGHQGRAQRARGPQRLHATPRPTPRCSGRRTPRARRSSTTRARSTATAPATSTRSTA